MKKNQYLDCVRDSYRMKHVETLLKKYQTKRDSIVADLKEEFGAKMYDQLNSGSYAKNTAINSKFDLDVLIPFKRDAFNTLEEMYDQVRAFLQKKYTPQGVSVRPQRVSIGLQIWEKGDLLDIDIVPGRELTQNAYPNDKKVKLHVEDDEKVSLQTNISAQVDAIRVAATENQSLRNIIRLLKVWKTERAIQIKAFFLELISIKAFEKTNDIPQGLWPQLEMTLQFIYDNILTISLIDPGNADNDVSTSLSQNEKEDIRKQIKKMLSEIGKNHEELKYYFPKNEKFPCKNGGGFERTGSSTTLGTTTFGI